MNRRLLAVLRLGVYLLPMFFPVGPIRGELPDIPAFATDRTKNCGPVCVKYLDAYFGGTSEFLDVVRLCPPSKDGTSLANLRNAAKKLGYETVPFRTTTSQLKSLRSPAILHQKFPNEYEVKRNGAQDHFFVVLGWDQEASDFQVFDPIRGNIEVTMQEMSRLFSGVGLMVSDSPLPNAEQLFEPAIAWHKVTALFASVFGIVFAAFFVGPRLISRRVAGRANVLLILVVSAGSLSQIGCQKTPDSDALIVDLGSHFSGDIVNHVFKVFNPSDTSLTFLGKEST